MCSIPDECQFVSNVNRPLADCFAVCTHALLCFSHLGFCLRLVPCCCAAASRHTCAFAASAFPSTFPSALSSVVVLRLRGVPVPVPVCVSAAVVVCDSVWFTSTFTFTPLSADRLHLHFPSCGNNVPFHPVVPPPLLLRRVASPYSHGVPFRLFPFPCTVTVPSPAFHANAATRFHLFARRVSRRHFPMFSF